MTDYERYHYEGQLKSGTSIQGRFTSETRSPASFLEEGFTTDSFRWLRISDPGGTIVGAIEVIDGHLTWWAER